MRANPLLGQMGGDWALEIETEPPGRPIRPLGPLVDPPARSCEILPVLSHKKIYVKEIKSNGKAKRPQKDPLLGSSANVFLKVLIHHDMRYCI